MEQPTLGIWLSGKYSLSVIVDGFVACKPIFFRLNHHALRSSFNDVFVSFLFEKEDLKTNCDRWYESMPQKSNNYFLVSVSLLRELIIGLASFKVRIAQFTYWLLLLIFLNLHHLGHFQSILILALPRNTRSIVVRER